MWRRTDYNLENSWEWVAAAENKLTFDTISLLAFGICSTITFHGKGEFEKNMSIPSSLRWLLLWTQLTTSRCMFQSLIKTQGRMKVLIAGSQSLQHPLPSLRCSFLTFAGVEWDRGLGGRRKGWSGLHRRSVILLQPVVLVRGLCQKMNNLITGAVIKNSISPSTAALVRGVNQMQFMHIHPTIWGWWLKMKVVIAVKGETGKHIACRQTFDFIGEPHPSL